MHVGTWGLAVIVVVIVSWLLYRYLAPQSWKEWGRAGLVQAFIIAFYAEMYGFPLTIYFLARFFGLDLAWAEGGNLWAQLFGTPMAHIVAMLIGYAIVFGGAILVADGWRRVHKARHERRLATGGAYARVRHPQYTGLFLIVFGEGIVHWPTIVSVIAFPVIVIAYTLLAQKEERQMIKEFGDEYRTYQQRVPMFIPRFDRRASGGMSDGTDNDHHQRRRPAGCLRIRGMEPEAASRPKHGAQRRTEGLSGSVTRAAGCVATSDAVAFAS